MEKISIIIPVYKIEKSYLCECIESILEQTYTNLEIILIDDGSPDCCGEVCDWYAKKDDRILVIHQKNQGVSSARNKGIEAATGKWISFVDADDWIEKNTYEVVMKAADRENVDMLVWNMYFNPPEKETVRKNYSSDLVVKDKKELEDINLNLLRTISIKNEEIRIPTLENPVCHLYKRSIIADNHLKFDCTLKQGEDKLFNYAYHMHIMSFAYLNNPLYHYRLHSASTTHTFFKENVDTSNRILEKYYELEPRIQTDERYKNTYNIRCAYIALFLINKYYLHSDNDITQRPLYDFKKMVENEPYYTAIREMDLSGMRFSFTRVRLKLLKMHCYKILFIDAKMERRIKSLLKK